MEVAEDSIGIISRCNSILNCSKDLDVCPFAEWADSVNIWKRDKMDETDAFWMKFQGNKIPGMGNLVLPAVRPAVNDRVVVAVRRDASSWIHGRTAGRVTHVRFSVERIPEED